MKTKLILPEQSKTEHFKGLVQSLVEKFKPLKIIIFGKQNLLNEIDGCFISKQTEQCHYCLLMVTELPTRVDHEAQEFVNGYYCNGHITVICHAKESIAQAVQSNNRFFIAVYRTGQLLYSNDGMTQLHFTTPFIPTHAAVKAEKHFSHRMSLAEGFLKGADECLASQYYNVCTFMLHQVVEQCCIVLVRVHTAYRSEFHNLHRLLSLCRCFSDEPYKMLLSGSSTDARLFDILIKSYSQARYASSFSVEKDDAEQLYTRISSFVQLTKSMCLDKMEELNQLALVYKQEKIESEVEYE